MRLTTVVVRGDVLASWLTVSDYTRSKLAVEIGVSKGRISQLLTSKEEPSAHLIAKLLLLTRLPFDRLFKMLPAHTHGQPSAVQSSKMSSDVAPGDSRSARKPRDALAPASSS